MAISKHCGSERHAQQRSHLHCAHECITRHIVAKSKNLFRLPRQSRRSDGHDVLAPVMLGDGSNGAAG
jgi:hypothetical protein